MSFDIRKISVGPNYKDAMHYTVGQTVLSNHVIENIVRNTDTDVEVWIKNESGELLLWKVINGQMPFIIECNINF